MFVVQQLHGRGKKVGESTRKYTVIHSSNLAALLPRRHESPCKLLYPIEVCINEYSDFANCEQGMATNNQQGPRLVSSKEAVNCLLNLSEVPNFLTHHSLLGSFGVQCFNRACIRCLIDVPYKSSPAMRNIYLIMHLVTMGPPWLSTKLYANMFESITPLNREVECQNEHSQKLCTKYKL